MFMLMLGCIIMSCSIMAACPRQTNEAMHRLSGVQNPLLVAAESIICHRAMPAPPASPASAPYPASLGTAVVAGRVRIASLIVLTSVSACLSVPGAAGRDPDGMLAIDASGGQVIAAHPMARRAFGMWLAAPCRSGRAWYLLPPLPACGPRARD